MARTVQVNIVGDSSKLERAITRADSNLDRLGKSARRLQTVLAGALAGGAVVQGVGAIVKSYASYDTALREVGAVSQASGKQLENMGKIARAAGLETGVGATEAAKAMSELAKAGLSTAQIGPALKGTLALAQAGGLATADAASAAANAMQTFGLRAKDTGRIADTFANAANLTTADVGDFALALSQGGAAAKIAGLSFSDTSLILTELARIGIKGSDAGTSLKSAFLQLAAPTDAAKSAMKKYGIEIFGANGKVRDASDISDNLRKSLGGLSNQQQIQVLKSIAGTDGFRTLAAMMKVSGTESDALSAKLSKQGSAADTARAKQAGFQGSMNKLKAAAQELGISLGERFAPQIAKFADKLTALANDPGTKDRIVSTFRSILDAAKRFFEAIKPGIELVGKLAEGFGKLPDSVKSSAVQLGVLALVARKLSGPLGFVGAAAGLGRMRGELDKLPASARRAQSASNGLANLNPLQSYQLGRGMSGGSRRAGVAAAAGSLGRSVAGRSGVAGIAAGGVGAALSGGNVANGALSGAALGAMAGPVGAAAGALAGAGITAIVKRFEGAGTKRAEEAARKFAAAATGNTDRAIASGLRDGQTARDLGRSRSTLEAGRNALNLYNRGEAAMGSGKKGSLSAGLKLQAKAEDVAKAAGLDLDALRKGTSKAFGDAGKLAIKSFNDGLRQNKNADADSLLSRYRAAFSGLPKNLQDQGARSMLRFAKGLEDQGRAPKGTVDRLAKELGISLRSLEPAANRVAKNASQALARIANDSKLSRSADKLVSDLADQFQQLPRAAVRSVPGAVALLGAQLDKLGDIAKDKNTPKRMRDQANAALPGLRKAYDQSLDRMARRLGISEDEARTWASRVRRSATRVGDGTIDVDKLRDGVDKLSTSLETNRRRAEGVTTAFKNLGLSTKDAQGVSDALSDLVGGANYDPSAPYRPPTRRRRGGTIQRFQDGGLVPALVSSGERIDFGGSSMVVPGPRVAADNVPMMLPVGAQVFTDHGQSLMAQGASPSEALAQQMPHFAAGGIVTAAKAAKRAGLSGSRAVLATAVAGPESGYRLNARLNNPPIEDSRGLWQINTLAHRKWAGRNLNDPNVNARAMAEISSGGRNFRPWSGYTSGKYRGYMERARAAVSGVGRIAAARGSEDGLEASTRTVNERVILGRSTTRARDAMSEAVQAGLERGSSYSRSDVSRFGNPFLQALRTQLDEARSSFTRQVTVDIPGVDPTEKAAKSTGSLSRRLKGTPGGSARLRRLSAALGTMQRIGSKGLPYTYGGGHGRLGVGNPGFDCSGYVSAGLGAAGWISAPMATQQGSGLNTLGVSGAGKYLTWGVRGSSGRNAHTMMKIGNQYFESGSGHGPRRVSGWAGRFAYRHMPGYARGGLVGRLGAKAPKAARSAVARFGDAAFDPKSPAFVGWGLRRGGRVRRFARGGVVGGGSPLARGGKPAKALSSVLKSATDENLASLDTIVGALAASRLDALRAYLTSRVDAGGDARTVERVKTALKQVTEQIGFRFGRDAVAFQRRVDAIDTGVERSATSLSLRGIDSDSIVGRETTIGATQNAANSARDLQFQRQADLARALKRTQGMSAEARKAVVDPIREQMKAAGDAAAAYGAQLDQLTTDLERNRPKLEAATRTAALDLRDSLAGLTLDKGDDRQVMVDRLAEQQRQAAEAQRRGDTVWLTEAAQGLRSAADSLRDFDETQKQAGFDFEAAMAALTEGDADDRAVTQRRLDDANQRLRDALAQGDRDRATQAATDVKNLTDALKENTSAQQEQKDAADALTNLLKQQVENQQKLMSGQAISRDVLAQALVGLTSGQVGSGFVRSAATPGTAGAGVRY